MFFGLKRFGMMLILGVLFPSVTGCISSFTESGSGSSVPAAKISRESVALIPGQNARVTKVRFFESGRSEMELREKRVYQGRFAQATTRTIYTEIHLEHPQVERRIYFPIALVLSRENGTTFRIEEYTARIDADWPSSEHWIGAGYHSPGEWDAGTYKVDVEINGEKVATGSFEIYRSPAKSGPLKWTIENPLALSAGSRKGGEGQTQTAAGESSLDFGGSGSLDQLRRGESSATPASSPLKEVYFAFDRDDLDAAARETLKANADWLKANPSATVQIEGHCDERGTNEYNLALGAKRAQSAKDYLTTLGIGVERLATISYGEELPVCKESTEECWAKNRRARFVIMQGRPRSTLAQTGGND